MTTKLPTLNDGVDGLLGLAGLLAVSRADVYRFLGFIRDNANGAKVVLEARQILAARMVNTVLAADATADARCQVADRLGYPKPQRPNFYDLVKEGNKRHGYGLANPLHQDKPLTDRHLPAADDGVAGLLAMIPTFDITTEDLFRFLGWLRYSDGAKVVGRAREILAAEMVNTRLSLHETEDLETAQLAVAKQLGYPTHQRPNFYKRVKAGNRALTDQGES